MSDDVEAAVERRMTLQLKVVTEADPGALVRVLQVLQMRNVTPLRVIAQRTAINGPEMEALEIEIHAPATGLAPEAMRLIAHKIEQLPIVLTTVACEIA